jgi:hypothetical protein
MLRLYEMNANEKERRDGVRFAEGAIINFPLSIMNFLTVLHFGELRKIMRKRFHSS